MEYPKSLYLKGWEDLSATVVVNNADEEAVARKDGYKALDETAEAAGEAPAKRTRKKAE